MLQKSDHVVQLGHLRVTLLDEVLPVLDIILLKVLLFFLHHVLVVLVHVIFFIGQIVILVTFFKVLILGNLKIFDCLVQFIVIC